LSYHAKKIKSSFATFAKVKRTSKKILLESTLDFKNKLLSWSQQFQQIVYLDSNNYPQNYTSFDAVLAIDAHKEIESNYTNSFKKLKEFKNNTKDYIFGYLSYDLKNDTENLTSDNFDGLQFPDLCFFQPKKLFLIKKNVLEVQYLKQFEHEIEIDLANIFNQDLTMVTLEHDVKIHKRITKKEYINKLAIILEHIHRGDIYEVCFVEGLVYFKDKWFLYYGTADSKIAVAVKE